MKNKKPGVIVAVLAAVALLLAALALPPRLLQWTRRLRVC